MRRVGVVRSDAKAHSGCCAAPNLPKKTLSAEAARVALIREAVSRYGSWGAHTSAGEAYTHVSGIKENSSPPPVTESDRKGSLKR